jgi:hypothetical protein
MRVLARTPASMSPPSAFSSISSQPANGLGSSERGQPDVTVALVREIGAA